jgi:hypothetical protein
MEDVSGYQAGIEDEERYQYPGGARKEHRSYQPRLARFVHRRCCTSDRNQGEYGHGEASRAQYRGISRSTGMTSNRLRFPSAPSIRRPEGHDLD